MATNFNLPHNLHTRSAVARVIKWFNAIVYGPSIWMTIFSKARAHFRGRDTWEEGFRPRNLERQTDRKGKGRVITRDNDERLKTIFIAHPNKDKYGFKSDDLPTAVSSPTHIAYWGLLFSRTSVDIFHSILRIDVRYCSDGLPNW